jgi:hypothetical protein
MWEGIAPIGQRLRIHDMLLKVAFQSGLDFSTGRTVPWPGAVAAIDQRDTRAGICGVADDARARRQSGIMPRMRVPSNAETVGEPAASSAASERTCPAGRFHVLVVFVYIPLQTPVPPGSPVERLVHLLDLLCASIAARGAGGLLTVPLFFLLWGRLRRTAVRAIRVAASVAAGNQPAARPRPALPRPASPRPSRPQPLRLPRGYAWVVRLVPGTAPYGQQLEYLLAEPEMARLAEAPAMRRLLNPLRQMLGVPARECRRTRRPAAVPPLPPSDRVGDGRAPSDRPPAPLLHASAAMPVGHDRPPPAAPVAA